MRIIFTVYAINAASLCFVLTLALTFLIEEQIENAAFKLFEYTYICYGPVLMICCIYGLIYAPGLAFECTLTHVTTTINFMDLFVLVGCTVFSFIITLFYAMQTTIAMVNKELSHEQSVLF